VNVWGSVLGVWLLAAFANASLIGPASIFPVIMEDLAVGPTAAGWIVSTMLGAQVLTSVPVGMALDRSDNRRLVLFGTTAFVIASVGTWQMGVAGSYWGLLPFRAFAGVALMVIWNGGINIIGRTVPKDRQATVIGIYTSSAPAGFALGQISAPAITSAASWPAIFAVYGGLALVGLGVFAKATRTIELNAIDTATPRLSDFRRVLTTRTVWYVSVMAFIAFSLYSFLNSWMPTYLAESQGYSLAASGLIVALFPAVGIISRSGGGFLSDRAFAGRRRPVVILTFVVTTPVLVIIGFSSQILLVVAALIVAGLFVQLGMGLIFTYIRELVDPPVKATAVAFLTSIGVLGAFSAPVIAGALIELTDAYLLAFAYAIALGASGLTMSLFAPESNP
jgi:nitrate/nitrite transporter NarK